MTSGIETEEKLIEAFHLMYDAFPGVAQLNHRSKLIVALNQAGRDIGRHEGMICSKDGPPERHAGCLANKALQEQKVQTVQMPPLEDGTVLTVFWLPIAGFPDYYIHFASPCKPS